MRRAFLLFALVSTGALGLSGCDSATTPDYEEQVVVSAALEVGERVRPMRFTYTVPVEGPIDFNRLVVLDATVTIELLAEDGSVEESFPCENQGEGLYQPRDAADQSPIVLPGRTYRLIADVPGHGTITAETTTPTDLGLVVPAPDEIRYRDQGNETGPSFRVTPSSVPGRQSVYLIQVEATAADDYEVVELDDGTRGVQRRFIEGRFGPTPDAASFIDDITCDGMTLGSCDFEPNDLASGSSPLLNQDSYVSFPDGSIEVTVPWLAFGFYGPHTFTLNALDAAFTDFVATQSVQFNPTTISPGVIPNVTTNIEGGLGVFGSFATVEATSSVVPQADALARR